MKHKFKIVDYIIAYILENIEIILMLYIYLLYQYGMCVFRKMILIFYEQADCLLLILLYCLDIKCSICA